MASINKVIVVGNLGRDPETRYTTGGEPIANIAVATSDRWKDKATGEQREATEWHRISAFGKLAEIMGQYLRKGSQVYIEGRLRTRKYTGKDGVERYATEIIADTMQMLGSRQGGGEPMGGESMGGESYGSRSQAAPAARSAPASSPTPAGGGGLSDIDDDIPF